MKALNPMQENRCKTKIFRIMLSLPLRIFLYDEER